MQEAAPPLQRDEHRRTARACHADATNTVVASVGIFAAKKLGFSNLRVQLVLLADILAGPLGTIAGGRFTDRLDPRRPTLRPPRQNDP